VWAICVFLSVYGGGSPNADLGGGGTVGVEPRQNFTNYAGCGITKPCKAIVQCITGENMKATVQDLATRIYSPLFAERDTIRQAYDELVNVVTDGDNSNAVLTAVHILLNSIAVQLEKANEQ